MYKVEEETLINYVKSSWKYSHTIDGESIVQDGWCPRLGSCKMLCQNLSRGDWCVTIS